MTTISQNSVGVVFGRCREANVFILSKMGLRNWLLVGNKTRLLLGGFKFTIFVVVAIGGA